MPTIPELVYAALLYPDNERPENPPSEKFVEGVPNENGDKFVFIFQRPDKLDNSENITFTLEVFAFVKTNVETEGGTKDFSRNSAPFSKAKSGLTIGGDVINVNETIVLEVNKSSTEKGSVNLKVAVLDGCSLEIDDTAKTKFKCERESETANTFAITADGISADVYPVTFTLKKDGEIIYIFTENINVFKILCTDTWGGLAKDMPKEITQDMISNTVYVRGSGEGWYTRNAPNATASDANSGSLLSPFETIQKAVNTIIARNDFTSNFTIYLDGKFTASSSAALADFSGVLSALSVRIAGLSASEKAVLDGNNTVRGIVVGSSDSSSVTQKDVNLTLENLIVQNTKYSSGHGGGITLCCESTNKHTIKNCEIKNNNASYGSAIYNEYGSLDLQVCEISDNTTGTSGTVYNGYESAILKMSDVKIENNSANNGGGVFLANDSTLKISDASVVIKGNSLSGSDLKRGVGICLWNGILELSGSAKLDDGIGFPNDSSSTNHKIVISGALNAATPVATITAASYKAESPVLSAGTDVQITQDLCDKFSLANERWTIIPNADKTAGVLASLDNIYLNSSSGDDANSGLLNESNAVKTLSKAIALYDKYGSKEIRVYAQYTLSSEESDLLNRTNKERLTLKRYNPTYLFYISQGDVTISNVTLEGNSNIGSTKGILFISGSTTSVTLGDGAILHNGIGDEGGAVHIDSGHLNMVGGEITVNCANNKGGGVFVGSNGTFTMSGGTISGNYNRNSSMKTSGAIYQAGTLEISGSASILAGDEGKNDVYLASGKTITVTGALNADAESPVATITPSAYTENMLLLSAGGDVTIDEDVCKLFTVTPQSDGTEWRVAPKAGDSLAGVLVK